MPSVGLTAKFLAGMSRDGLPWRECFPPGRLEVRLAGREFWLPDGCAGRCRPDGGLARRTQGRGLRWDRIVIRLATGRGVAQADLVCKCRIAVAREFVMIVNHKRFAERGELHQDDAVSAKTDKTGWTAVCARRSILRTPRRWCRRWHAHAACFLVGPGLPAPYGGSCRP